MDISGHQLRNTRIEEGSNRVWRFQPNGVFSYRWLIPHCTVLIGLEPIIVGPLRMFPVSVAELSPQIIPVSGI